MITGGDPVTDLPAQNFFRNVSSLLASDENGRNSFATIDANEDSARSDEPDTRIRICPFVAAHQEARAQDLPAPDAPDSTNKDESDVRNAERVEVSDSLATANSGL